VTQDNGRFEIDRRHILIVLMSRLKRQIWLLIFGLLFAWLLTWTPASGLDQRAWTTVCIFALCAALWATSLLPLAVTSLLAIALVPLLDVLDARTTYAYFGSKVVFFILGAFMLAAALISTGLSKRLATLIVRHAGQTPKQLVRAVFLLSAAGSTLMSEHAVAVMIFPVVRDIAKALNLKKPDSLLGRALFLAMMWGCIIGGSLTVLGGGRAPLAIGILEEVSREQVSIGFVEYIVYSFPLVAIMLVIGLTTLSRAFPHGIDSTASAMDELEKQLHEMGKVSPRELVVGLVLVVTVVLWAFAGDTHGLANIAICSMAAIFALGALKWKDIQNHVNWGIVVMYGGAICLGGVMESTGAAAWITRSVVGDSALSPTLLMLCLAPIAAFLTEFMSNSAVVAMLMPPALSLAHSYGVDLRIMTMAVVLPSNFAFMFPISTPVTAMSWSGGYFTPKSIAMAGLGMHAIAWIGMAILILGWWPFLGLL
jgi:sodium-dependent dicarboxylate transporter 2/3/5